MKAMKTALILLALASSAALAQHYVHNWMQTGCSYAGQTRVCTYTCLIGGETIAIRE